MAVRLNKRAFEYAKGLISAGRFVYDDRDEWSEHQPSAAAENRFIEEHGYESYARWHLGIDDVAAPDTKAHYKFPYGDFANGSPVRRDLCREPCRTIQVLRHRRGRGPTARHD